MNTKLIVTCLVGIVAISSVAFVTTSAATILFPSSGGTGISTVPTYGQLLVGNSGGTYTLTATSSLGILAWTPVSYGNATSTTLGFLNGFLSTASSTITGTLHATGGVTGALTGNASTATTLATARTINGTSFDGSANITITAASSTLLSDSNTFSGVNGFGVLSATYASTTQIGSTGSAYFATSGGNVGIGTTTPGVPLAVSAAGSGVGIFGSGVAISPSVSSPISVQGSFTPTGGLYGINVQPTISGGTASSFSGIYVKPVIPSGVNINGTAAANLYLDTISDAGGGAAGRYSIYSVSTDNSYFAGNVGIGSTSPSSKLTVQGNSYVSGTGFFGGALIATSTVQLSNYTSGALAADASGNLYTFATSTWSFASSTLLADSNTFSGSNTFSSTITGDVSGNAGTVTNGVYTTTFNSLFDPRFITDLAATSSVASITTLPSLSLPSTQVSGSLGTINGTTFNRGDALTVASTTLLSDTNGWSALNTFANATTTLLSGTTAWFTTFIGDLTGNASTATTLATARTINGTSFDGSANITITAASSTLLSDSNTFSGSNAYGTPSSITLTNATGLPLTTGVTGTLPVANGGTGATTLTGLLQGNGTSAITAVTGTAGQFPYYSGTNTLSATSSLFLATSGNVGVGTVSPVSRLALGVGSNSGTKSYSTNSQGGFDAYNDTGDSTRYFDLFINGAPNGAAGGSVMRFMTTANTASTYAVERMRIDSSGNVGIGTTDMEGQLSVLGASAPQLTAALTDAGSRESIIALNGNSSSAGSGGAIIFGNNQSMAANSLGYAAIKGLLTGGGGNTIGDLAFSTRNATSDTSLTERMRILAGGNVGIGDTSPASLFTVGNGDLFQVNSSGAIAAATGISLTGTSNSISSDSTASSGSTFGLTIIGDQTVANTGAYYGLYSNPDFTASSGNTLATLYGVQSLPRNTSSGTVTNLRGYQSAPSNAGSGTVASLIGYGASPTNSGSGSVTALYGALIQPRASDGTVTNMYGVYVDCGASGASAVVTTCYGLRIAPPVLTGTVTNVYGVYQDYASAINYFGGNVGIGTTNPSSKLQVAGDIAPNAANSYNLGTATYSFGCLYYNSGTLGTCASDERLKTNIQELSFDTESTTALDQIAGLTLRTFAYKSATSSIYHGLIAQEVELVAPELVVTDASTTLKSVKYGDVQWLTLQGVQELYAQVRGYATEFASKKVVAEQELCIGETCVTEEQLKMLLKNQ